MKKRHHLAKILSTLSFALLLGGCTTLSYIGSDYESIKSKNIQTEENFNVQTFEKTENGALINIGVSETVLDQALVLYVQIQNNSDSIHKFDMNNITAESPVGDISFISPSNYIEAFQNFEAQNYAGMVHAGSQLSSFANIQSQYMQNVSNSKTLIENRNQSPELIALEKTIEGIQEHTVLSYRYVNPGETQYFYVFLVKPEEYPIVVKYKGLTYKFGNKKDSK